LTEWIPEEKMTNKQKKKDPYFYVKKGTLVKRTYHEAWAKAWPEISEKQKKQFLNLPNFCPEIFKEITGIDVRNEGKIKVEANGKVVYISKDSAVALGLIDE
jgi:hypothetical protein